MLAVVYEAMANAGPGREGCEVPRAHRVKKAVYPSINLTLENIYKLFFLLLGVGPGTSLSRRQSHQVHANLEESRSSPNAPLIAGVFVAVRVLVARLGNQRGGNNEWGSFGAIRHAPAVTQA